jgi:serine/threonine protein kinase HipA of HipAB toxin-antitoxin module
VGDWNSITRRVGANPPRTWNSITSRVGANPPQTQSRTHGPSHELLSAAGQNVTHDTKGNITLLPNSLRPSPLALTWDLDNRMSSADVDNDSTADVTYQFDALGRRVVRKTWSPLPPGGEGQGEGVTTIYIQSGQQTIADYPSRAASTQLAWAL